jgi:iron(III) transport system substrate-binding protein
MMSRVRKLVKPQTASMLSLLKGGFQMVRSSASSITARLVLVCILSLCPFYAFGDVQPVVDQINGLPEKERNQKLLEGAQKEGVVNWYTDMQPRNAEAIVKLLSERHPFLKVEVIRLGHERLINRLTTEYRAGKFIPDVITAPSAFVDDLKAAGITTRNLAPFKKLLRQGIGDKEGWVNAVSTTFYTMFYNTNLVKPADLPKSYQDLLHSRWKGMIAIDQEDAEWLAALIETMGRENAIDFARKLAANKPNIRRGHTLLGQLVAGGESAIFPDQYLHSGINLKNAGAPVEMYFVDPVLTQSSDAMWVARRASRPHAGLFFIDFLFSRDVQMTLAGFGRLASRQDVNLLYGLDSRRIHYLSRQWVGENYRELNRLFREIFSGG